MPEKTQQELLVDFISAPSGASACVALSWRPGLVDVLTGPPGTCGVTV